MNDSYFHHFSQDRLQKLCNDIGGFEGNLNQLAADINTLIDETMTLTHLLHWKKASDKLTGDKFEKDLNALIKATNKITEILRPHSSDIDLSAPIKNLKKPSDYNFRIALQFVSTGLKHEGRFNSAVPSNTGQPNRLDTLLQELIDFREYLSKISRQRADNPISNQLNEIEIIERFSTNTDVIKWLLKEALPAIYKKNFDREIKIYWHDIEGKFSKDLLFCRWFFDLIDYQIADNTILKYS